MSCGGEARALMTNGHAIPSEIVVVAWPTDDYEQRRRRVEPI